MIPLLQLAWIDAQIYYHELAMCHLHKNHPDIPHITLTIRQLNDRRDAIVRRASYLR